MLTEPTQSMGYIKVDCIREMGGAAMVVVSLYVWFRHWYDWWSQTPRGVEKDSWALNVEGNELEK